ncbi:MAG: serine hydrolase [Candidatus Thermoplasmatota archaeon]|nr:serine hydrolase [Candidatus Thermoplasmatota archaeon]
MEKKTDELPLEIKENLEDFIADWMSENKVPGMSVAVIKKDDWRYTKGFGARDLSSNEPVTPNTLFGMASITKSFTALAVMRLVERGELSLDDRAEKYVPIDWDNEVTIHHLLTHSSGMPSLGMSEALIDRLIGMDERGLPLSDLDDFYTHLNSARDEIAAEPGEEFFYFNSGYALLGQIIEKVSGKPYPEFIKDEIFEPLEMKRSRFDYDEEAKDMMTPYFMGEDGPEETPYPLREIGHPGGGLLSSAEELANYLEMNINGGEFKGEQLVDPELLEKAHEGHITREVGDYGYGWAVKEFNGEKFVGHGGSIAVSGGFIGFVRDFGVAVCGNTIPGSSYEELAKWIIKTVKGEDGNELTYFKRKERLDRLTGTYESYRGIKEMEIEKVSTLLKLTVKERLEEEELILIPKDKAVEDFEFYYLDGNGEKNRVRFEVREDGEIDLFIGRWRLHKKDG